MNQEIKNEWLAALRSGDYVQGQNYLRREDNTFCCLGVLCEIAVRHGVIEPPEPWEDGGPYVYGHGTALPPPSVVEWSGLGAHSPTVDNESLTGRNDTGWTFEEIADLIEVNL